MKTGGSNYIAVSGDFGRKPLIGLFHRHAETVESELRSMYEHGQRKITFNLYFASFDGDSKPEPHVDRHLCNSRGGRLCDQQQENIKDLLDLISGIGYNELHFRFAAQGDEHISHWGTVWTPEIQRRFEENRDFILSTIQLIEANNELPVMYDLAQEHARRVWDTNGMHRRYCMSLWRAYNAAGLDPNLSCAFSSIGVTQGVSGITPMLRRFRDARLPFPGHYCFDVYDYEYSILRAGFAALQAYGQQTKPVWIQECYYNDATSYSEIKRAISDTAGLNFAGIFQWPRLRGTPPSEPPMPEVPRRFDNYLVEV